MAAISNSELCNRNGVAIFRVGEVYECNEAGGPIPEADLAKWFVAVPDDGRFGDHRVKTIPLSDTYEHAEARAVAHLGLADKVCPECSASVRTYSQHRRSALEIVVPVVLLLVLLGMFGALNGLFDVSVGQHNLTVTVLAPIGIFWMIWQVTGPNKASSFYCAGCGYSE